MVYLVFIYFMTTYFCCVYCFFTQFNIYVIVYVIALKNRDLMRLFAIFFGQICHLFFLFILLLQTIWQIIPTKCYLFRTFFPQFPWTIIFCFRTKFPLCYNIFWRSSLFLDNKAHASDKFPTLLPYLLSSSCVD